MPVSAVTSSLSPLVSVDALRARLGSADLRLVDASWHLPAAGRDAAREFAETRLPGAVFFDIDAHAAPGPLPHMLPTAAAFTSVAASLGIGPDDDIVIYDAVGLFSAPRVRWMFRHFGASRVTVLDGGLPAWIEADAPVESGAPASIEAGRSDGSDGSDGPCAPAAPGQSEVARCGEDWRARLATRAGRSSGAGGDALAGADTTVGTAGAVADAVDVLRAAKDGSATILDARSVARFSGHEPEARPGLRSGHVPGSVSLPFTELLDRGRLKPDSELREIFVGRGVALDAPIVTTCGSGVTAAVISLALERLGATDVSLYDGSWAEWGGREDLPVERG